MSENSKTWLLTPYITGEAWPKGRTTRGWIYYGAGPRAGQIGEYLACATGLASFISSTPLSVPRLFYRTSTTASALSTLDEKINDIAKEANIKKNRQIEYDSQLQTILKDILDRKEKQNSANRRTVFGERDNIPMDIDESPLEFAKGKNRKYVVSLYLYVCSNLPSSQDATRSKSQGQEEKQTIIKSSTACIIRLLHIVKYENKNL